LGTEHRTLNRASDTQKNVTILVVEDEAVIRLMIADALREAGFGVVEAGTGDEALSLLESGIPVNLVFTDVMMPGKLDGLSLVSRLRVTRPELKVVVGSALSPVWPAPNFVDLFIGKPYDVPRAIARLKALLRNEPHPDAIKDAEGASKVPPIG
jgi:DNA-binding response OmpR family regulator